MTRQARAAVRRVLREAGDTPNFWDLNDGERMVRMLEMAWKAEVCESRNEVEREASPCVMSNMFARRARAGFGVGFRLTEGSPPRPAKRRRKV
jgi:hypothetical protein